MSDGWFHFFRRCETNFNHLCANQVSRCTSMKIAHRCPGNTAWRSLHSRCPYFFVFFSVLLFFFYFYCIHIEEVEFIYIIVPVPPTIKIKSCLPSHGTGNNIYSRARQLNMGRSLSSKNPYLPCADCFVKHFLNNFTLYKIFIACFFPFLLTFCNTK